MGVIRLHAKQLHDRNTLGIMSGTSLDGVDLSLVRFNREYAICEHKSHFTRFPPALRKSLFELAASPVLPKERLQLADAALGMFYLSSAQHFLRSIGSEMAVDLVGCHGQTIYHRSAVANRSPKRSRTLQIGSPDFLAQGLCAPVVSDFRSADVALGGRGAPLTPIAHHYIFSTRNSRRLVVNIGGISNATYLPGTGGLSDIVATDCGPGNMLIDQVCSRLFGRSYDRGGKLAAQGVVHKGLLRLLKGMSFLHRKLPLALGREQFGEPAANQIIDYSEREGIDRHSVLCTVTLFTAYCIARAARGLPRIDHLLICGGGAHNAFLTDLLLQSFPGIHLSTTAEHGVDPDFVESASFALLANLAIDRIPGNLPQVTGAAKPVILGRLTIV